MSKNKLRLNQEIRALEMRVIGPDGNQLGVLPKSEALLVAEGHTLDLVEINPNSVPPVCRIMDYGKFKYQQTKKEKEAKKKQHVVKLKEVKLRPRIDDHDYQIKLEKAKGFLDKGCKVKITLIFRGREMAHKEIGEVVLKKFCGDIVETHKGAIESDAKLLGRNMTLVMSPTKVIK